MRRPGKGRLKVVLLVLTASVALVGCGSSGNSSSNSKSSNNSTSSSQSSASGVSSQQVQATIDKAMGTHVPASSLSPVMVDAFSHAAEKLSAAQMAKAFTCWKTTVCTIGNGPITLGIADGSNNTWREFVRMEDVLQAMTYPQIGKVIYLNAGGNLSTMISNVRTLVSDGAKAIITYDDFGGAVLPAYAAAQRSGAVVSNYIGSIPGVTSSDVSVGVISDLCTIGKDMADAAGAATGGSGGVAYFSGTPGNPQGQAWSKCATKELSSKYPNMKPVGPVVATSWTPAGAFQAASGLISSGKDAKAILYDYANPVPNIVQAYQQAHKPVPAIVTWTEDNQAFCVWNKAGKKYPFYYTNGITWVARTSITADMEKLSGKQVPSTIGYPMPFVKASGALCHSNLPADYPGDTTLIPAPVISKMLSSGA